MKSSKFTISLWSLTCSRAAMFVLVLSLFGAAAFGESKKSESPEFFSDLVKCDWKILPAGKDGGNGAVEKMIDPRRGEILSFSYQRTCSKRKYGICYANIERKIKAECGKKFRFDLMGDRKNKSASLTITMLFRFNDKSGNACNRKKLNINYEEWHGICLDLADDFGVPDGAIIYQIKLVLSLNPAAIENSNTSNDSAVTETSVRLSNISFLNSTEVVCGNDKFTGKLSFGGFHKEDADCLELPLIKVFAEFDNGDMEDHLQCHLSNEICMEKPTCLGYRALLFEPLAKYIKITPNPKDADVIVFGRLTPSGKNEQDKIKGLISGGANLIASGTAVAGVEDILPVKIFQLKESFPAMRKKIKIIEKNTPLFAGMRPMDISFGIYHEIKIKPGAKVLAEFTDGSPAIVEGSYGKGKVIYSALGHGQSIARNDASPYYCEFILRSVYYLTGHEKYAANLTSIGKLITSIKKAKETALIADVLADSGAGGLKELSLTVEKKVNKALESFNCGDFQKMETALDGFDLAFSAYKMSEKDKTDLDFQLGMSRNNFGRFGWNISEGLLATNIGNDFTVSNGLHEYSVSFGKNDKKDKNTVNFSSVDWVHKKGVLKFGDKEMKITLSLLLPFVRYDVQYEKNFIVSFTSTASEPDFVMWPSDKGIVVKKTADSGECLFELSRDGKFSKNWLICWSAKNSCPLMVVFQRQPEFIRNMRSEKKSKALKFDFGQAAGNFAVGYPWGKFEFKKTGWDEKPNADVLKKTEMFSRMLVNFPVGCDEIFALDMEKRKVRILNRFKYERTVDDWQTPGVRYALLPPLVAFAKEKNKLVEIDFEPYDFELPTKYGDLKGIINRVYLE
ncbi:MAG: hypothetical protein PHV34_22515 [Verrucomicrobiae bacterium]|nr:hypothetical protein [Verrucomicrobiae bacterium]